MNNREVTQFNASEADRRIANGINIGIIEEARYDAEGPPDDPEVPWFTNEDALSQYRGPLYRVRVGEYLTYWLPQLFLRAGNDLDYWAYEVGEQVVIFSPSGDPMQGFLLGALPQDNFRPPTGLDDVTKDKRPWRETVRRTRSQDGWFWEYDRYLHRESKQFNDGTLFTFWFLDDRSDRSARQKETNSDRVGTPPRHFENRAYRSGVDYLLLWDEDDKHHHQHWQWPDGAILDEYTWDYENLTHVHHRLHADGTEYHHTWDEQAKTHTRQWTWPDGRDWSYVWDEQAQTHTETLKHADGVTYLYQWDEQAQTHTQRWHWPDGYTQEYAWDESAATHHRTTTYADGSVHKYHWDEGADRHLHEMAYADGTVMHYCFNDPQEHRIQYADGSFIHYNLKTHTLTAAIEGDAHLQVKQNLSGRVDENATLTIGQSLHVEVAEDAQISATGNIALNAGGELTVKSDTAIVFEAPQILMKTTAGQFVKLGGGRGFEVKDNVWIDGDLKVADTAASQLDFEL